MTNLAFSEKSDTYLDLLIRQYEYIRECQVGAGKKTLKERVLSAVMLRSKFLVLILILSVKGKTVKSQLYTTESHTELHLD